MGLIENVRRGKIFNIPFEYLGGTSGGCCMCAGSLLRLAASDRTKAVPLCHWQMRHYIIWRVSIFYELFHLPQEIMTQNASHSCTLCSSEGRFSAQMFYIRKITVIFGVPDI